MVTAVEFRQCYRCFSVTSTQLCVLEEKWKVHFEYINEYEMQCLCVDLDKYYSADLHDFCRCLKLESEPYFFAFLSEYVSECWNTLWEQIQLRVFWGKWPKNLCLLPLACRPQLLLQKGGSPLNDTSYL